MKNGTSHAGVLKQYGVELIGANRQAIEMAEDRKLFREAMDRIGLENPKATIVAAPKVNGKYDIAAGVKQAMEALEYVGLPAIIRPAFTLGGTGGGVAYNREDYERICKTGLDASPVSQILIDESLLGWKEFEMEVVRDKADNCIIVCSIENIDPMGVHTGDSITVAPALTLTDKEYQVMRNASIAVLREIGVETGGSNVQFAVHPDTGRLIVIEMNPRVSRSSALASKATGFPIAKIAAKLAVGYTLDELDNDITQVTPASFEPTIDYVVTKIPRFAFEKFPGAEPLLTTAMKSVGEAMAIGRSFHESLQKALCSLETGLTGLDEIDIPGADGPDAAASIVKALSAQTPDRLRLAAQAMRLGLSDDAIHASTRFDPWFLARIREIVEEEERVRAAGLPATAAGLRRLKMMGFSDARLAKLTGRAEASVRADRQRLGIRAVFKRIDTCGAEFEAQTPYMYSTYEAEHDGYTEDESRPTGARKVVILGGGLARFDAADEKALTAQGYQVLSSPTEQQVATRADLGRARGGKVFGLFNRGNLTVEKAKADNPSAPQAKEPTLAEMTTKAISLLDSSKGRHGKGFYLQVEGALIDKRSHANDAAQTLGEIKAFDDAVKVALDFAKRDGNTLVIVTADHECAGFNIIEKGTFTNAEAANPPVNVDAGNPANNSNPSRPAGNTKDSSRSTGIVNGQGANDPHNFAPATFRTADDPRGVKDGTPEASLWLTYLSGNHTGADVPIYAYGWGSEQLQGTVENTDLFRIVTRALRVA